MIATRLVATTLFTVGAGLQVGAQEVTLRTDAGLVRVETIASGLDRPWGLAFLPDNAMLVTEKPGRLRIVAPDGSVSRSVEGAPEVDESGQGGLLDVVLHPGFAENRLVYIAFSEPGPEGSGTAVARGVLDQEALRLTDLQVIFRQQPKVDSTRHFGSRLVFDRDGRLWATFGERYYYGEMAQELGTHLGKVVRINDDGSVPADNPFVGEEGALPAIWSYGHRNPQGAALHPETGIVWIHEHGARGGDEVNIPQAGANYGWPLVSYGVNYDGTPVGTGEERMEGVEDPVYYWDPSIAPSGMAFYTGDAFPAWQGDLFLGALAGQALHRLALNGESVTGEERMLEELGERIRDVRQGPDGMLYLLTDSSDGRILRLAPAS